MVSAVLLVLGVTLALALLFIAAGRSLFRLSFGDMANLPLQFSLGFSFFLGMSLFTVVFNTLGQLTGSAARPFWAILALLVVVAGVEIYRERLGAHGWRAWLKQFSLAPLMILICMVFLACWYVPPWASGAKVMDHFGSIHSGRSANLATWIVQFNHIPRIGQNSGQALLAAANLFLGAGHPTFSLMLWVAVTQTGLAFLLYGLFRLLKLPSGVALAGSSLTLLCNIALSSSHVNVLDTLSPVSFNGAQDSLASFGTLLAFLAWLCCFMIQEMPLARALPIPMVLALSWNLTGPQNIVLCGPLLFVLVARCALLRQRLGLRVAGVLGVFALCAFCSSRLGGMLMPPRYIEDTGLPHIMSTTTSYPTTVDPFCPFVVLESKGGLTDWDHMYRPYGEWEQRLAAAPIRAFLFWTETRFWETLRIFFFPILGMALATGIWLRRRELPPAIAGWLPILSISAVVLFVPGYLLCFTLRYHGYKWELSRFVFPGVLVGLVCLVVALHLLIRPLASRPLRVSLWTLVLFAGTFGPVAETGLLFQRHYLDKQVRREHPVAVRLQRLLDVQGINWTPSW